MKKMLICLAFFGFVTLNLVGCGGSTEPTVVEPVAGPTMAPEDQKSYEEQMKSGGSQKPGN